MAIGDNYITRDELKTRLGLSLADTTNDTRVDGAIATASREVELICNRQFNKDAAVAERQFGEPSELFPRKALLDDFYTTTGLVVKVVLIDSGGTETSTTLDSTDYKVGPLRPTRDGLLTFPQWKLLNMGFDSWPSLDPQCGQDKGYLKVTAAWGWDSVPTSVKEATYILAEEYFKLKEAPFGITNWGEFGPVRVRENVVVKRLLMKYRKGGVRI